MNAEILKAIEKIAEGGCTMKKNYRILDSYSVAR